MAKGNPLQEQLLKAGLVKKSKVSQVAREQVLASHGKGTVDASGAQREAARVREEKARRDRELSAERKALAYRKELGAQARQIIKDKRLPRSGDIEYRFTADGAIRSLLVDETVRRQLAVGSVVIARLDARYELLPRAAGDMVRLRDPGLVVLDHGVPGVTAPEATSAEEDAYYAQFKVPDDLVW